MFLLSRRTRTWLWFGRTDTSIARNRPSEAAGLSRRETMMQQEVLCAVLLVVHIRAAAQAQARHMQAAHLFGCALHVASDPLPDIP